MSLTKIRGNTQIQDLSIGNTQIANAAGIELQKIQDGTLLVKSNGTVPFTTAIAGVTPTLPAHLATKEYVDNIATGLDFKESVRAISRSNIVLSGTQVVDGVSLIAGDRVLVVGQTLPAQNGIYVVAAGAWARSQDADNTPSGEVTSGMFTFIEAGTLNATTGWVLSTPNPIVLGTTALTFTQFSEAGQVGAGAGLVANGSAIDVVSANGGIVVGANNIALTVDPNGTLGVTAAGIKLADLPAGRILVGNASNVATAVIAGGDVTVNNSGVFTVSALAITESKIAALAVTTAKIADDAVTQDKLADNSVGSLQIANTAVTTAKIADDAITQAKIADSAVGTAELAALAVTTAKIANAAVTISKIEALPIGEFVIGTAGGNDTVAITGDITVAPTGVATINSATVIRTTDVITRETPAGALNGVNAVFTLANTPKVGTEHVYVNGLLMDAGAPNDYTISGAIITFTFVPVAGDKIRVSYFK